MASVYAQDAIKWEDLSEPEQNLLQEMQSQWDSLAPERQQPSVPGCRPARACRMALCLTGQLRRGALWQSRST